MEASEEECGERWLLGGFTCTDPDEDQFVVLFVHTSFLHVVVIHFPFSQECDVEECEELDAPFRCLGCSTDDDDSEMLFEPSEAEFDFP